MNANVIEGTGLLHLGRVPTVQQDLRSEPLEEGRRLAFWSMWASAALAVLNVASGAVNKSTSVVATGFEFAGDTLASFIVFLGMLIASRPPDENHPYGHGRFEILAGLLVGLSLLFGGVAIAVRSLDKVGEVHAPPGYGAIWALIISMIVKSTLAITKFRGGRRIGSMALIADAWNDTVDLLSAIVAMVAVVLAISNPEEFLAADHYGGFAIGIVVVVTGIRVVRDASMDLTDTMPPSKVLADIRRYASEVAGVEGVEKCFARKTGLRYHVDIHIEVEPAMTVARSHEIATDVRFHLRRSIPYIADVLVHVEPSPGVPKQTGIASPSST